MKKTIVHKGFYTFEIHETPSGKREVLRTSNVVDVLIYEPEKRRILLVRQPRLSMITEDNPEGMITEVVAGRLIDGLGVKAQIVKEIFEEVGVKIFEDDVELLNNGRPVAVSAGAMDEMAYLAYVEIKAQDMEQEERIFGVSEEGEKITRVFVDIDDLENYICEDARTFALIQWFLRRIKK